MHRLIYHTRSLIGSDRGQVDDIVEHSIPRNAARDITGMLWFDGIHFAQALEGDAEAIHALLAVIRTDRRHTDMHIILDRPIITRMFGRWSMMRADDSAACGEHTAFMLGFSRTGEGPDMKRLYEIIIAAEDYGA